MALEGQERNPHGDEMLVGDATQEAGVEPAPGEGAEALPAPSAGGVDDADGADDETGAGISARDADREEGNSG